MILKKGPVGCGAIKGHGEGGIYTGGQDHGEKSGETQQEVVPCDSGNKTSPFSPKNRFTTRLELSPSENLLSPGPPDKSSRKVFQLLM